MITWDDIEGYIEEHGGIYTEAEFNMALELGVEHGYEQGYTQCKFDILKEIEDFNS